MVAAVAGLAAVGVVVVQNVVGGTAEQVASSSARQTAADLAVTELQQRWRAEVPASPSDRDRINRLYAVRCRQLGIIYADISLSVEPPKGGRLDSGGTGWDPNRLPSCALA